MPAKPHRLQLLLDPHARGAADKAALKAELGKLGIEISGEGAATLSARISEADFARLFAPADLPAAEDAELPIPDSLRGRVTTITVAPPHLHLE